METSRDSRDLFLAASDGDPGALEELLVRHLPGLRAFVRLRAGPQVRAREAESDLVQSTCREVLSRRAEFRYGGEAGFRHWLYTTALRKILDKHEHHTALKRDARREQPAEDEATFLDAYRRFASPSGALVTREELQGIEAAFARLPEDYREVILLSRVVGLSRPEVASQMGRSEGSVRNLLHRALLQLSALLDDGGDRRARAPE